MIGLALWAVTAAALAQGPVVPPEQQPTEIAVGQVIGNEVNQVINGWTSLGGGHYARRTTANFVTTEVSVCCYSIFEKGDEYLLARSEPIARNPRGGVLAERIEAIYRIKRKPTEEITMCNILWLDLALSLYDNRSGMVRSIVVTEEGFEPVTWKGSGEACELGH